MWVYDDVESYERAADDDLWDDEGCVSRVGGAVGEAAEVFRGEFCVGGHGCGELGAWGVGYDGCVGGGGVEAIELV